MKELVLEIEGMSCNHCVMTVEKALKSLEGIKNVDVDLSTGEARVSYEGEAVDKEKMKTAVEESGYKVK